MPFMLFLDNRLGPNVCQKNSLTFSGKRSSTISNAVDRFLISAASERLTVRCWFVKSQDWKNKTIAWNLRQRLVTAWLEGHRRYTKLSSKSYWVISWCLELLLSNTFTEFRVEPVMGSKTTSKLALRRSNSRFYCALFQFWLQSLERKAFMQKH